MKKRRLKLVLVGTLYLIFLNVCLSQVTLSPDPKLNAQCPEIQTTFTLSNNFNADCHEITPEGCSFTRSGNTLTVIFFDNGKRAKITIAKKTDSGCSNAASGKVYDEIPIKTLFGLSPTITGPTNVPVGFANTLQYTASLNYPFRGTNDPPTLPVTNFIWTLPVGWTNTTIPSTSPTITVVTDLGTGGPISAEPIHACVNGLTSAGSRNIQRTLSAPCPVSADFNETYCGDPPRINSLSATAQPTGYMPSPNGISYTWTLPTGWTFSGPSTTRNVNVTMDGQHGGNVTVVAKDYGVTSPPCTFDIPLRVINSTALVVGAERLCAAETYNLSHPIAPGATASWAITPSNAPISPLQGSGSVANLTTGAGGLPGTEATLEFTVSGCGITKKLSRSFFVGRPLIEKHQINGTYGASQTVCPGWHILVAQVLGDDFDSGCMTWELVNNQGNPPHTLYQGGCEWGMVYLNPLNSAPAFVKVTADNECGATSSYFYLYPHLQDCKHQYYFSVYPNPASDVLNLEVFFDDGDNDQVALAISHAQLINTVGVVAKDLPNIITEHLTMDLADVPGGLYVVRAKVGDEWHTKTVQVSK